MQFIRDRAPLRARVVIASAVAAAVASSPFAVAKTWDNSSLDGLWKTPSNWDDNIVPTTATPVILPAGTPGGASAITATGGTADAQSLTFNDSYTLSGTSVLTLGNGDITVASGFTGQIDLAVGGTAGLHKLSPGTLVLTSTNNYTGGTRFDAGVVTVASDANLGAAAGALTFNGGKLRSTATMTTARNMAAASGSSSAIDVATGASTFTVTGTLSGAAAFTKTGSGTLLISGSGVNSNTGHFAVSSGTLRLNRSGGNALGGPLDIGNAQVIYGASDQLASDVSIDSEGNLDLNGFTDTIGSLTLTGATVSGNGILTLGATANLTCFAAAGASMINGGLNLGALQRTFSVSDGVNPNDLVITGALTNGTLVKTGVGNLVTSGASPNTITGVTVNDGTLTFQKDAGINAVAGAVGIGDGSGTDRLRVVNSDQIINTAAVMITSSGVLEMNGVASDAINTLAMTGGGQVTGSGTIVLLGDVTINASPAPAIIASQVELSGSRTFNVADGAAGADLLVSGSMNSGNLVKAGAGMMALTNSSPRTGTTVIAAGTLSISADSCLGAAGGQLDFGNGSAGTVTLATTASTSTDRIITINTSAVGAFDVATGTVFTINTDVFGTGGMLKLGSGTLVMSANLTLSGSAGTMTVNAGSVSHSAGNKSIGGRFLIGSAVSSNGTYSLSGGVLGVLNNVLGVSSAAIGISGTGSIAQTGGTFNVSGTNSSLVVGEGATGIGAYTISAGTLNARRLYVGRDNGSSGTVNVNGGALNVTFDLEAGVNNGATGTVNVTSGTVTTPALYIGGNSGGGGGAGVLNVSGGTLAVTGEARVWDTSGGTAINFSSPGTLRVGSLRTSGNVTRFAWSGGTLEFTSESPQVGTGADLGTSVTLSAGKTLRVSGTSNTINVRGTGSINFTGGKADLTDKKMIVVNGDVGTATGGVYTGLTRQIQLAYNGGAWNGPGITTSKPDAVTGLTAIGIGMAGDLGYNNQLFGGVTVSGNTALLMYTYAGDANLDGFISGDDYTAIDFNIAVASSFGWSSGDFNYDGIISGDDYAAIDFNIVAQAAPFPVSSTRQGLSAVPEPGSIAVLALSALGMGRSRRNRRSRRGLNHFQCARSVKISVFVCPTAEVG